METIGKLRDHEPSFHGEDRTGPDRPLQSPMRKPCTWDDIPWMTEKNNILHYLILRTLN